MNIEQLRLQRGTSIFGLAVAALGLVTLSSGIARAGDGDGLRMQREYEARQVDCAHRARDQATNPNINMFGCAGFDQGMPPAATAALMEDRKHTPAVAATTFFPFGQLRQAKLSDYTRNTKQP